MSVSLGKIIARSVFWRYQRGSWQYDILCGLILVFIFLIPKSVFDGSYFKTDAEAPEKPAVVEPDRDQTGSDQNLKDERENDPSGS